MAASIGKNKVSGIGHDAANHVASIIANDGMWVSGKVVQEEIAGFTSNDGGFGLIVGDFI